MMADEGAAREWVAALPGVGAEHVERLEGLVALLRVENESQNLVSAASLEQVWVRHIVDSAQLLVHVPRETSGCWLDLGTGAGFPGLVISALQPEREVVMVESRARRVDWLERARIAMGLSCARIEGRRLELVETREVEVISARAFAPLDKLLSLSSRFSTSDTRWVLPKGQSASQELADLRNWRHAFHVEPSVTDPQAGIIVGTLVDRKGKKS